jgi:hypothetical protein
MAGCVAFSLFALPSFSQEAAPADSVRSHRAFSLDLRPEYVFGTNEFLEGRNLKEKPINSAYSAHLTYGFRNVAGDTYDKYGDSFQGMGIAVYSYGNSYEMGSPFNIYFYQGSTLFRMGRRASLNYEWNFGGSFGWHTYDPVSNPYNGGTGSKVNAYLNFGLLFDFVLSRHFDLTIGASATHFSNGNTAYPNAGVNNAGARIGLVYYVNRYEASNRPTGSVRIKPHFRPHMCYDLMAYGAWRHGYATVDGNRHSISRTFPVAGINFAVLCAVHQKFRLGLSLDGTYDHSANITVNDVVLNEHDIVESYGRVDYPSTDKQLAAGLSARFEYVMPYFTIAAGLGHNFIYSSGDMSGFYQSLSLKIRLNDHLYANIGYNLQNFKSPNHMMLGVGYTFF